MSFQIERGLFLLDFTDHHAILGVPVDAEIKDIRKRYLKIARLLHPDSGASETEEARQRASDLLSKLVNPAWERLSQERDRSEYMIVLKLKGQQGLRQQGDLVLSNLAKQLAAAANPDHFYTTALKDLATKQYEQLDQMLELTAQLSELNLVYLMRKEAKGEFKPLEKKTPTPTTPSREVPINAPNPPPPRESPADQYYRRAEAYIAKNNFAQATLELREGLQADPSNSRCHSLMGMIYLKQNQGTMAKIHFNKALQLNPQDTMAHEGRQRLEQVQKVANKISGGGGKPAPSKGTSEKKPDDKAGGGLFGLFGGKKK
ncbi:J domain-containing protein [Stenomitos frigidus]|uniref:Molecular chaperone DnaJ n=1 Tax=Stenomitos frigidus ULC18 TaxID=2107698 RepID=A0A2T1ESF0_9CYAN|nr:J domain-containing protein [Stenomitos frigidus]PSB35578.1 molecular chaperone DnaJ [Stenomitos frigidus ULC18]